MVGYRLRETATGATLVYVPSLARWPDELDALLDDAHCVLLDGTFWTEDEMAAIHPGSRTATAMGHLPISGPGGTLARLRPGTRLLYTHLNNTNPLSDPDTPARAALAAAAPKWRRTARRSSSEAAAPGPAQLGSARLRRGGGRPEKSLWSASALAGPASRQPRASCHRISPSCHWSVGVSPAEAATWAEAW